MFGNTIKLMVQLIDPIQNKIVEEAKAVSSSDKFIRYNKRK